MSQVYVVDCGKHKEKTYDADAKIACLLPAFVSQASAVQRRGRAGRVQAGVCYHLFTEKQFNAMAPYQLPEMVRPTTTRVSESHTALQTDDAGGEHTVGSQIRFGLDRRPSACREHGFHNGRHDSLSWHTFIPHHASSSAPWSSTPSLYTPLSAWRLTALDSLVCVVRRQVRTPLNQLCLTVRALGLAPTGPRGVESFLLRAVTPPSDKAVANALDLLLRVGALDTSEALTPLGRSVSPSLSLAASRSQPCRASLPLCSQNERWGRFEARQSADSCFLFLVTLTRNVVVKGLTTPNHVHGG